MNKEIDARTHRRSHDMTRVSNLIFAACALIITLGISSLALYTPAAGTQELGKTMPTPSGDAAIEHRKKEAIYGSLEEAVAAMDGDDLPESPDATTKLIATSPRLGDMFGTSVAVSGDTAIIGAPGPPNASPNNNGTAYIFIRNGAGWAFQQRLTSPDSPVGDRDGFGLAVGISGDTAVVGARRHGDPNDNFDDGAAYVFVRTGTVWTLQKKLSPADTPLAESEGEFGQSVAISGETVLVGTNGQLQFSEHSSFVHVFVREGTVWTPQALLTSIDELNDDFFGASAALSGDMAIIGDPSFDPGIPEAAYIFVRCGTTWTRQQRLTPGDSGTLKNFGGSVAISGNTVIIGAEGDKLGTTNRTPGSAYIFVTDGTTWTQQQKLTADDGSIFSGHFGFSVAILGDTAIVGKPRGLPVDALNRGSVYAYLRTGATWALQQTISASDGAAGDEFGHSVAISPDAVVVGAPYDDPGTTHTSEGSAYMIDRTTAPPPPVPSSCGEDIEVNITTDQVDADLEDDECDVDLIMEGKQCSLRAAIQTANAKEGPDEILFNIPGGGVQTISPGSALPNITEKVTIDGTTQPGYSTQPLIEVRGTLSTPTGLEFGPGSDASSLLGISILGFSERGILLLSNNNSIKKSHIGTDSTGLSSGQIQRVGVAVRGSGNKIGDTDNGNLIVRNTQSDILIEGAGATGNFVRKNIIGFDGNGDLAEARAESGITIIDGASGNIIGGSSEADLNEIAGDRAAIEVSRGSNDNVIIGNTLSFSLVGVLVLNSSRNRIGGEIVSSTNNEGNQIDTNIFGVLLDDEAGVLKRVRKWTNRSGTFGAIQPTAAVGGASAGSGNMVFGNLFVVSDPELAEENSIGVMVSFANDTLIGNGQGSFRNIVADCSYVGIIVLKDAQRTKIEGNFVGLAANGTIRPNKTGIRLAGSGSEVRNNIISGNTDIGLAINRLEDEEPVPTANIIDNNWIGTNTAGTAQIPNGDGVIVDGQQNSITNNVISGNTNNGLHIQDNQNTIANNRIGTDTSGNVANRNDVGLLVTSSTNTITGNTVSGNGTGISIGRDPLHPAIVAENNIFQGNTIGTNRGGTAPLGNDSFGVVLFNGARANLIGGLAANQGNVISGNGQSGIVLQVGVASGATAPVQNKIQGNFIGTNASGTTAIPNVLDGIFISAASSTLVGGIGPDIPGARNIISGNGRHGLSLSDGATLNRISGNYIGTKIDGTSSLGNIGNGIRLGTSVSGTIIGGPEPNSGNTIGFNGNNGIRLDSDAGNNNIIDPNRIFGNVLAGIDIGGDGFTPNDPTDADTGPNKRQNYPTMTLSIVGGDLIVIYQVDSAPQHSAYGSSGIYVEFFEADSTGAGQDFLGSDHFLLSDYTNGTPGTRQKNLGNAAALGIVAGDRLTATATDADGNSSEFTPAVSAPAGAGFEGDVAPRPNGDGVALSTDITQLRRFVTGLDTPNPATNEVQRADCAPRASSGDGAITSGDVVQARRYVTGLDPQTAAGGPTATSIIPETFAAMVGDVYPYSYERELRVGKANELSGGKQVSVAIEFISIGDEVAISFTLEYDASKLGNPRIQLGEAAPRGATLTFNANYEGRIGILVDSTEPMTASAMPKGIVKVTFDVVADTGGETPISLTGALAAKGISDATGNLLALRYLDGKVVLYRE